MLSRFHLIPERNGQTDGHICYINIARDKKWRIRKKSNENYLSRTSCQPTM